MFKVWFPVLVLIFVLVSISIPAYAQEQSGKDRCWELMTKPGPTVGELEEMLKECEQMMPAWFVPLLKQAVAQMIREEWLKARNKAINEALNNEPEPPEFEVAKATPTLKAWIEKERKRVGVNDPSYYMKGSEKVCELLQSVGLGCSLGERGDLVSYLYAYGVKLFSRFYAYYGSADQNIFLEKQIQKNRHLFKNGDLTAEAASKWKK